MKYKEQTYDRVFRVTVKALEVAPKTFTISLPEHVTADHEGDIVKDTLVTLTVTTPAGKVFKELIVNGVVVAVEGNTYSFTLTKDTIVTVTFEDQAVDTYTLTLPEGVESTHKGNIATGTSVTLTVNVPANHRVSSFRVNDQEQQLNENNEYTFTISRDTEVEVSFVEQFTIQLPDNVLSSLEGKIDKDTEVTLTVNVPQNHRVSSFKVNGEEKALSLDNKYTFNITENITVQVEFVEQVTLELSEGVTSNTELIIDKGTSVVLTVEVPENKRVASFKVNGVVQQLDIENQYTFVIEDNASVEVLFEDDTYSLELPLEITTNIENLNGIIKGTEVVLTINTPAGKLFKELRVNGVLVSVEGNTYAFTLTEDVIVSVVFVDEDVPTYKLTLPESVESTHKGEIIEGTNVTLTVKVPVKHRVTSFKVNDQEQQLNENNEYTFTISRDTVVEVSFVEQFSIDLADGVTSNTDNLVDTGTSVILTVAGKDKNRVELLVNGEVVELNENNQYEMTATTDVTTEVKYIEQVKLTLGDHVKTDLVSNFVDINSEVKIIVVMPEGEKFKLLRINEEIIRKIEDDGTYTFTITEDTEVSAEYYVGPSTDFKLKVEGPYITATQYEGILAGDVIILTIHVPKGAEFVALNINDSSRYTELGEGNTHEFAVYEDLVVSVEFNFGSVVHASNEAELNYLLENEAIKEIVLENNMELTKPLLVTRTVTINGNSKTLTLLTRSRATWSSPYVIHVYNALNVVIETITLAGGNAGLLVNGSEVTVSGLILSNHSHGGIEVSQGTNVSNEPKLVVIGEIQAELGELPVIWIDGKTTNDGWVGVTTGLTELVRTDKNQVWYLSAPLTEMTVSTEAELLFALSVESILEITLGANIDLTKSLLVTRAVTINGNGNSLIVKTGDSFEEGKASVINVYETKGVNISNIHLVGGYIGLIVNGSEVTVSGIRFSNQAYGAINVGQGVNVTKVPKLIIEGTVEIDNNDLPTVWIDGKTTNDGWVVYEEGTLTEVSAYGKLAFFNEVSNEITVTTEAELILALSLPFIETIKIKGTIGSANDYNVYTVNRAVTILGQSASKVFGTFIIKSNGVEINGLAIENKGDSTGSTANRGAIYVYAENVILKNNIITTGLTGEGLANGIQIMSTKANTHIENYKIKGNTITGLSSKTGTWSSSGIVFSQGFDSPTVGGEGQTIIGNQGYYEAILTENTFNNNKIDLTHQDWSKESDEVVLFPVNNA